MFLLIFVKPRNVKLGETRPYTCGRCGREGSWEVWKLQDWLYFFFIPVFPVSTRYVERCPGCGGYNELSRQQAESACVIHS